MQRLTFRQIPCQLFILSDCKSVIDMALNSSDVNKYVRILTRIRSHLQVLQQMGITVTLIHIPGHCNIKYNDLADTRAKRHGKRLARFLRMQSAKPHVKHWFPNRLICVGRRGGMLVLLVEQLNLCPTVGKKATYFFHWTDAPQSAMYGCYCMIMSGSTPSSCFNITCM